MNFRTLLTYTLLIVGCQNKNFGSETSSHSKQYEVKSIELDTTLIEPLSHSDRLKPTNPMLSFSRVATFTVDLNNNGKTDSILLYNMDNKGADPGDFNQIRISLDDGKRWSETNFDGWVRFNKNYTVPDTIQSQNQMKTDLLLLTDFGDTKLLGLFTWTYASDLGLLTLIEFSSGYPRIMFNQKADLISMTKNSIVIRNLNSECSLELNNGKIRKSCK